jgi:hypothetical protein
MNAQLITLGNCLEQIAIAIITLVSVNVTQHRAKKSILMGIPSDSNSTIVVLVNLLSRKKLK